MNDYEIKEQICDKIMDCNYMRISNDDYNKIHSALLFDLKNNDDFVVDIINIMNVVSFSNVLQRFILNNVEHDDIKLYIDIDGDILLCVFFKEQNIVNYFMYDINNNCDIDVDDFESNDINVIIDDCFELIRE